MDTELARTFLTVVAAVIDHLLNWDFASQNLSRRKSGVLEAAAE